MVRTWHLLDFLTPQQPRYVRFETPHKSNHVSYIFYTIVQNSSIVRTRQFSSAGWSVLDTPIQL